MKLAITLNPLWQGSSSRRHRIALNGHNVDPAASPQSIIIDDAGCVTVAETIRNRTCPVSAIGVLKIKVKIGELLPLTPYNRTKRDDGGHGDQKSDGQNVRPNAAETLAEQHGVSEKTIRRDGKKAEALEQLAKT